MSDERFPLVDSSTLQTFRIKIEKKNYFMWTDD